MGSGRGSKKEPGTGSTGLIVTGKSRSATQDLGLPCVGLSAVAERLFRFAHRPALPVPGSSLPKPPAQAIRKRKADAAKQAAFPKEDPGHEEPRSRPRSQPPVTANTAHGSARKAIRIEFLRRCGRFHVLVGFAFISLVSGAARGQADVQVGKPLPQNVSQRTQRPFLAAPVADND